MSALNEQVGGSHYKKYKIQPIEYAMANHLEPCESYIVKYVTRHRDKNGAEDLLKARHLLDLLLECEYNYGSAKTPAKEPNKTCYSSGSPTIFDVGKLLVGSKDREDLCIPKTKQVRTPEGYYFWGVPEDFVGGL